MELPRGLATLLLDPPIAHMGRPHMSRGGLRGLLPLVIWGSLPKDFRGFVKGGAPGFFSLRLTEGPESGHPHER